MRSFISRLWFPVTCLLIVIGVLLPTFTLWHYSNLPQHIYIGAIRHLYFDCLQLVDGGVVYKAKPGVCQLNNQEYRTVLHHDASGYRNRELHTAVDVVLLGDSHTHGVGVEDNETFASLLASRHGYQTRNLGMGSYATARELEALRADSVSADVIVIQYCDNDFRENLQAVRLPWHDFTRAARDNFQRLADDYQRSRAAGWKLPFTLVLRRLFQLDFESKNTYYQQVYDRHLMEEAYLFAKILARYKTVIGDRQVIVFESSGHGRNHPAFKQAFEAALSEHATGIEITVLNATDFIDHQDYYFLDPHPTAQGHSKIADALNQAIDQARPRTSKAF